MNCASHISEVLAGKKVLLCEDEGIITLQLRRAMMQAGLIVCGAESTGEEAVAVAKREEPDLVIMDVGLPGMSGIEAARRIMLNRPTCVVLLTGHPRQLVGEPGFAVGACACLTKPVQSDTLIPELERVYTAFQNLPNDFTSREDRVPTR